MRRGILVLGGIALALVVAELLLRLINFGQMSPRLQFDVNTRSGLEQGVFVADRQLFWRQADGSASELDRALKMVQRTDPVPERNRRFRIIVLGDSCSRLFGDGLPYSALLEQRLGPDRTEVYNASLPGYTSHQGLAWLNTQLLAFRPDLLVVYFGWNDHWRSTGMTDREYAASLRPGSPRLMRLFRRPAQPAPLRVPPADYTENLRRIAGAAAAAGSRTMFVLAPYHFTAENVARLKQYGFLAADEDVQRLHRQYLRIARAAAVASGSAVCDAAAIFDAVGKPRQLLQRDGIHLTDAGHAALAATLADQIARSGPGGPGRSNDASAPDSLAVLPALTAVAGHAAAQGQWDTAATIYQRAVAAAPAAPGPRLGLAWLMATCPADSFRDATTAAQVLQPLADQEPAFSAYWDVAAAVAAEAGSYDRAVAYARRALDLAAADPSAETAESQVVRELKNRLALYQENQPYRQPHP